MRAAMVLSIQYNSFIITQLNHYLKEIPNLQRNMNRCAIQYLHLNLHHFQIDSEIKITFQCNITPLCRKYPFNIY